jgi:hypothetical protein
MEWDGGKEQYLKYYQTMVNLFCLTLCSHWPEHYNLGVEMEITEVLEEREGRSTPFSLLSCLVCSLSPTSPVVLECQWLRVRGSIRGHRR